jgi:hypothetical protein
MISAPRVLHGVDPELGVWSASSRRSTFIFGVSFAFLFASMSRDINLYDEGLIVFGAVRVMNGDVPYHDFYANYGPAQFYVLAALFKIFGPSILIHRIWDTFVRAAIVMLVYAVFARMGNPRTGMIAAAATAIWLSAFGAYGYPVFPCLLMSILSVYFVLDAYCGEAAGRPLLLTGGCIGVAGLFRHDVGAMAGIAHVSALVLLSWKMRSTTVVRLPKLIPAVSTIVVGTLLIAVPVWSAFIFASPAEVFRDLIVVPIETYTRMRSLPFPLLSALVADFARFKWDSLIDGALFMPAIVGLTGIAIALTFQRNSRDGRIAITTMDCARCGALLLVACFSLFFTLKGVVRVSLSHMALAIVPSLLTVCLVWLLAQGSRSAQVIAVALAVPTILTSIGAAQRDYWSLMRNKGWAMNAANARGEHLAGAGMERLGPFRLDVQDLTAIRFVQERTAENERIFVGLSNHDRIFVNDVMFYFLSKRLSATKWHHFDPGVQTTREVQSEMVNELEAVKPKVIVLRSDWSNNREPNGSSISSGVSILDDFIHSRYVLIATFGSIRIYELFS